MNNLISDSLGIRGDLSFNAMIFIDELSIKKIKNVLSDLEVSNIEVIHSLMDINEEMVKKYDTLILLEEFPSDNRNISELKLVIDSFDLNIKYVGVNRLYNLFMSNFAKCYNMPLDLLDYDTLYGVVFDDYAMLKIKEQDSNINSDSMRSTVEENALALLNDLNYGDDIHNLCRFALACSNILEEDNNLKEDAVKIIEDLKSENALLKKTENYLISSYNELFENSRKCNKILLQYENIVTRDVYDKILLTRYQSRPFVMYFKEYEELVGLDRFIETLSDVFRIQYSKSCKVVKLFDNGSSKRLLREPLYYTILRNKYTNTDIYGSDFLIKYGAYVNMFDMLLSNKSGLDILIVVDCKEHSDSVMIGDLNFNMCRESKNLIVYDLSSENTIVNDNKESGFYWEELPIKDFDKEEYFTLCSSMPSIVSIASLYMSNNVR